MENFAFSIFQPCCNKFTSQYYKVFYASSSFFVLFCRINSSILKWFLYGSQLLCSWLPDGKLFWDLFALLAFFCVGNFLKIICTSFFLWYLEKQLCYDIWIDWLDYGLTIEVFKNHPSCSCWTTLQTGYLQIESLNKIKKGMVLIILWKCII